MFKILYSDKNIAVCIKPAGVSSEGEGMPLMLKKELEKGGVKTEVYPLHRLDVPVGGVMVFALNKATAAELSEKIAAGEMRKEYLAVVHGTPEAESGEFEDLLFKDSRKNKSFVVKRERKGVKRAKLEYSVIDKKEGFSLVKIRLKTGRSHQIRVQFSSRKMPLVGDGKYGSKENCSLALFSFGITLPDGRSFSCLPEDKFPWNVFKLNV